MRMTTDEYEANLRKIESLRASYSQMKDDVSEAMREQFSWEEAHLAELHRCEELNNIFEGMEQS